MEFLDENIFTVANRGKIEQNSTVYAARNMKLLRERVLAGKTPSVLDQIDSRGETENPYKVNGIHYPLVYFVAKPKPLEALEANRMISPFNADSLSKGAPVILGDSLSEIKEKLRDNKQSVISRIGEEYSQARFIDTKGDSYILAYKVEPKTTLNFLYSHCPAKTFLEGESNYKVTEQEVAYELRKQGYRVIDFRITEGDQEYKITGELLPF